MEASDTPVLELSGVPLSEMKALEKPGEDQETVDLDLKSSAECLEDCLRKQSSFLPNTPSNQAS